MSAIAERVQYAADKLAPIEQALRQELANRLGSAGELANGAFAPFRTAPQKKRRQRKAAQNDPPRLDAAASGTSKESLSVPQVQESVSPAMGLPPIRFQGDTVSDTLPPLPEDIPRGDGKECLTADQFGAKFDPWKDQFDYRLIAAPPLGGAFGRLDTGPWPDTVLEAEGKWYFFRIWGRTLPADLSQGIDLPPNNLDKCGRIKTIYGAGQTVPHGTQLDDDNGQSVCVWIQALGVELPNNVIGTPHLGCLKEKEPVIEPPPEDECPPCDVTCPPTTYAYDLYIPCQGDLTCF